MTLLSVLLLVILFLTFFIYFSGLNPQDVTVFLLADHQITTSVAILVVGCLVAGLALGFLAHLYHSLTHQMKHWSLNRREKKAKEVTTIYREGVARLLSGDIKKAHTLLQKALDRDPARIETYLAMASVYIQEQNPQQGVTLLLKARELEPKSLEILFKLANTYQELNRPEDATKVYQEILAIESGNRKALRSLRDLFAQQGQWKDAEEMERRVLKVVTAGDRQKQEQQLHLHLRYEVARQNLVDGQLDQAIGEFKDIIKKAPEFSPARVSLGDALRAKGEIEEAAQIWQQGYEALDRSVFLSRLEDLYMATEDPTPLLNYYRTALDNKSDDMMLRLFFGKLALRLEMVDEALEQFYAVEGAGVESPQLHLLLAEAHRRRHRIDEAVAEYKKALGVNSRLSLGYVCDACAAPSADWQSRCPECGAWGGMSLAGRESIKSARPLEVRAIHHGERS